MGIRRLFHEPLLIILSFRVAILRAIAHPQRYLDDHQISSVEAFKAGRCQNWPILKMQIPIFVTKIVDFPNIVSCVFMLESFSRRSSNDLRPLGEWIRRSRRQSANVDFQFFSHLYARKFPNEKLGTNLIASENRNWHVRRRLFKTKNCYQKYFCNSGQSVSTAIFFSL